MIGSILFVGGGRMSRAMAAGIVASGLISPAGLRVADHNPQSREWWSQRFPETPCFVSAAEAEQALPVAADDLVVLAVKPQHLSDCIATFRQKFPVAWQQSLVVSVAAGVDLDFLTGKLGSQRVARVMPNTPALVGAGASAYCGTAEVSEDDLQRLRGLLDAFGRSFAVKESQMDAVTGLSGSGPAYVFLFIEALADGGVMAGLPRAQALQLAAQTVIGAGQLVLQTGEHPGMLKDAVASPAGTTIAAIRSLEQNGFRGAVIDAVLASANRSAELRRAAVPS